MPIGVEALVWSFISIATLIGIGYLSFYMHNKIAPFFRKEKSDV